MAATAIITTAGANNYGADGNPNCATGVGEVDCYPQQTQGYWYGAGFGNTWQEAAQDTFNHNIDPTDGNAHVENYWPSSEAEVYSQDYGDTPWIGRAYCDDEGASNVCVHWTVQFNNWHGPHNAEEKKHLVCHEFGHSWGLQHYPNGTSNSCMRAPSSKRFSSHDDYHINGYL